MEAKSGGIKFDQKYIILKGVKKFSRGFQNFLFQSRYFAEWWFFKTTITGCFWKQARNQNFFSAGEVLLNQGISINFSSKTQKKALQGKILELFLLDILKTTFWIEDSTQGWTQLGSFFPNSGHFFRFSKKGWGVGLPFPPLVAGLERQT